MKKTLLLAALAAMAYAASAQVTVDWSTETIDEPTQINSTVQNGSTVNYKFVGKNNGTDSVKTGDTILYQIAVTTTSNQLIVAAPSANSFYLKIANRNIAPSDTIHISGSFNFGLYPTFSSNVNVIIISHVIHRGRGLGFESGGGLANNTKVKQVVWYNPQGWGVSVKNIAASAETTVYPNQTTGRFTVEIPVNAVNESTVIRMYNMQGQMVKEITPNTGSSSAEVDGSDLNSGTYIVETQSGSFKSAAQVLIQK